MSSGSAGGWRASTLPFDDLALWPLRSGTCLSSKPYPVRFRDRASVFQFRSGRTAMRLADDPRRYGFESCLRSQRQRSGVAGNTRGSEPRIAGSCPASASHGESGPVARRRAVNAKSRVRFPVSPHPSFRRRTSDRIRPAPPLAPHRHEGSQTDRRGTRLLPGHWRVRFPRLPPSIDMHTRAQMAGGLAFNQVLAGSNPVSCTTHDDSAGSAPTVVSSTSPRRWIPAPRLRRADAAVRFRPWGPEKFDAGVAQR